MRLSLMAAALGLVAACGTNDTSGDDGSDPVDCTTVTGTDTFTVGLEKAGTSGLFDFKLMTADPAPPARGDNTWTVQVSSMASGVVGAPVDGATLHVTPYMPAHMHTSQVPTQITAMADPGTYKLDPVNLWMPGVWETTIRATSGATSDSAVYKFCIP
jgi:hypothetical protein